MSLSESLATQNKMIWPAWIGLAIVLGGGVFALRFSAPQFGFQYQLMEMPIFEFALGYVLLGFACAVYLPWLISHSMKLPQNSLLFFVLFVAIFLRLGLLGVPSILEDDYNRYLWDGAVTASGLNPYAYSPEQVLQLRTEGGVLDGLIKQSGEIFGRINYPEFSTVYPPAAQFIFAIPHFISPFSLDALRLVMLVLELGCIFAVVSILKHVGRSPLWVALYAWNPLVIKEVGNSVHMEPILMLPVLIAVWLVLKKRMIWASAFLAVAAGVKVWPALLIAVIWRQLLSTPKELIKSGLVFGSVLALMVAPVLLTGLSEKSGFVAFGGQWQASSAAYLVSEWLSYLITPYWVEDYLEIPLVSRLLLAFVLLSSIALICFQKASDESGMIWRMFFITTAIYILSPSNTPWYYIWIAPFLCFFPSRGLFLAGVLIPLHYLFFHFSVRGDPQFYQEGIVWLIWLPVWALLLYDYVKPRLVSLTKVAAS